jgi:Chemotaxis phosphatase CheX
MCSLKLPEPLFRPGAEEDVYAAVSDVAERSFFCLIDPCAAERFAELAAGHDEWLMSTVHFDDGQCTGSVSCRLPVALAIRLFDAFTGRDPVEAAPPRGEMLDLVGEFANMICGAWLTKAINQRTFTLSPPTVIALERGEAGTGLRVTIEELPCAIDVAFGRVPSLTTA